jgi:hypothetical protein
MAFEIKHGDCLEVMRGMADNSVDAIVTDPPYGLSFMGKKWDYDVPTTGAVGRVPACAEAGRALTGIRWVLVRSTGWPCALRTLASRSAT